MARGDLNSGVVKRLAFVRLVFFVFLTAITLRLFELQVMDYSLYAALASGQHDLWKQLIPERGEILAQDKFSPNKEVPISVNRNLNLIYAVPKDVVDYQATAKILAPLLNLETSVVEANLNKPGDPYEPLKHEVADELAKQILDLKLAGIAIAPETIRYYPEGKTFGQLTGFVGFANEKKQGQYGIEQSWETALAGTFGRLRSEKDAAGRLITLGERELIPAVNGANVVLTVDKNIQYRACSALDEWVKKHGAKGGSVVIMDPSSGAIRALCNAPDFDPNNYRTASNISVFANAAASAAYEPGSIFKPITMAAALDKGAVTPDTTYVDSGVVTIGPDTIKNSDEKAHGLQTMTNVLELSLNTGAIFAMRQAGAKQFSEVVERFGFGQATNIELPHESSGNIKSLKRKSEIYPATASFGQGISATPLQLAAAFGAVANKGRLMRPMLVQEVRYADGKKQSFEPTFVRQVIAPQTATTLGAMMVSVVERGHGKRAAVPGYYVAGKTGTAEVALPSGGYAKGKNIGSFVGFAPVDDPKFVMLIKIVEPGDVIFAESSAAPLFGDLAKYLLQYYEVPPTREIK